MYGPCVSTLKREADQGKNKENGTTMSHVHHLPKHVLVAIFLRLPLCDILSLELVCRYWQVIQELSLHRITSLTVLGATADAGGERQRRFTPSKSWRTNGAIAESRPALTTVSASSSSGLRLIRKSQQRFGISISDTRYHLTLSSRSISTRKGRSRLTTATCDLLLKKLPNITKLDLVQISIDCCLNNVLRLLDGWTLTSFALLEDREIVFHNVNGRSNNDNNNNNQQQQQNKQQQSHLHRLLNRLSPQWQPQLRRLVLVTFDDRHIRYDHFHFDLSQLEEFHFVRPWDLNRLLTQVISTQNARQVAEHLRHLTLFCDGNFSTFLHLNPSLQRVLPAIFRSLISLTLNFSNENIVSLISRHCDSLRSLHLSCVSLSIVQLAIELERLNCKLRTLRLTFPTQSLGAELEWSTPSDWSEIPRMVSVRTLHLSYSTLLHKSRGAASVLRHIFPQLHTIILDRNKLPQSGATCRNCAQMRLTAPICRLALIRTLAQQAQLISLNQVFLQVENLFRAHTNANTFTDYQVFRFKTGVWSIESVEHF